MRIQVTVVVAALAGRTMIAAAGPPVVVIGCRAGGSDGPGMAQARLVMIGPGCAARVGLYGQRWLLWVDRSGDREAGTRRLTAHNGQAGGDGVLAIFSGGS